MLANDIATKADLSMVDLIHAHTLFTNGGAAFLIKKRLRIPYVVTLRNTDLNLFFKYAIHLRGFGNEILAGAERVIFLSESYKKRTLSNYVHENYRDSIAQKSIVIPSGVNPFWLLPYEKPKSLPDNSPDKIVYAGKLDANKNISSAILAVQALLKNGLDIKFIIIGKDTGNHKQKLKKLIHPSFKERIVFHPHLPKEELKRLFRQCKLFLMPSFRESFGLVYAEALSQGLPVIYSRNEGFDGLFEEGEVGYSVNPSNINEIGAKITLALQQYPRLSKNAIAKRSVFNWEKIGSQYLKIYQMPTQAI